VSCKKPSVVLLRCAMLAGSDANSYKDHSRHGHTYLPSWKASPLLSILSRRSNNLPFKCESACNVSGDEFMACSMIAPLICHRQASCSSRAQILDPRSPMSARIARQLPVSLVEVGRGGGGPLSDVSACREPCMNMHV
jgi:hypothetical protein